MNNIEFENLVAKFLERAKVLFLKKGIDYEDNENYPTYIILDEKRTTFYITESASYYENFITSDSEKLANDFNLDISLSSSFLQLGKDNKLYTAPFQLNNGIDISSFTRKSAILIERDILPFMEEFLNKKEIEHQAASLDDITVLFLNESSNDKLVQIYNEYSELDDIQPIFTPKDDVSVIDNLEKFNAENQGKPLPKKEEPVVVSAPAPDLTTEPTSENVNVEEPSIENIKTNELNTEELNIENSNDIKLNEENLNNDVLESNSSNEATDNTLESTKDSFLENLDNDNFSENSNVDNEINNEINSNIESNFQNLDSPTISSEPEELSRLNTEDLLTETDNILKDDINKLNELTGVNEEILPNSNNTENSTNSEPAIQNDNSEDSDLDDDDDEELAMLDNLDLEDLLKPITEEDKMDETQTDIVYGHILNEQNSNENIIDDSKNNLVNEEHQNKDEITKQDKKDDKNKSDKKKDKETNDERKKQLKIEKDEFKKAKKERSDLELQYVKNKFNKLDSVNNLFANIMGIIFFLPLYVFNKLLVKILPPFIIYWAIAIITVFLGYLNTFNTVLSYIPKPFESMKETLLSNIDNIFTTATQNNINNLSNSNNDLIESSISIIRESLSVLQGQTYILDYIQNNFLLIYLISAASILMIFPVFRKLGKTLTVFSILYYFVIPSIYYIEYVFTKAMVTEISVEQIATVSLFTVYATPLLVTFITLVVSYLLVPSERKRENILP